MNLLKIKELAEKRPGGLRKLAFDSDMSEANLHRRINANKIQATDLEKIASVFGVPVGYFFDEVSKEGLQIDLVNDLKKENKRLQNVIADYNLTSSHLLLAVPMEGDYPPDMREVKDKVIKILSK